MNRFHYILSLAITIAVPGAAYSQTWDLGKDGSVTQKQTADTKGAKKQDAGDRVDSKSRTKSSVNDDDLKQQVNQKFGTDAALRYILVEVQNANITLSGTVPTKADKKRAVHLAKLVPGVRKVRDSLTVDANASSSSDNEPTNARNSQPPRPKTTANVRTRTRPAVARTNGSPTGIANRSASAAGSANSVGTPDGSKDNPASGSDETHLGSGATGNGGGIAGAAASASLASSSSAGSNAGSVAHNTGTGSGDFSAIPVPMMRPLANTATLKGQIENALRNDAQVGSSNLNVNVTDTTIELSGNVPTGRERTAAYRIAQSYSFNRRVQDHMTVTGRGNAGAIPGTNPATPAGNVDSGKPAVGSASTPNVPKSKATADGNAFTLPRD